MAILKSYYKVYRTLPEPDYFYIKNEYNGNNTLTVNLRSNNFNVGDGEYKLNDGNWTPLTYGQTNSITIPANGKVYFRATEWGKNSTIDNQQFSCTQNFSAGGNVMSINDYQNMEATTIKDNLCFRMFLNGSKLIKADFSIGNATTVGSYGFANAFQYCTNLTTAPDFSSLTSVDRYAFQSTFQDCSSLTTAPDFSSLTSVGIYGFVSTFQSCSSLTTAPDFSNVTSVSNSGFASTFRSCTSLMTAPDFSNATSVSNSGFVSTFQSCTKLNYVYAPSVSSWNANNFSDWLNGVASYGIVRKKSSLIIPTGSTSGVPTGWETELVN